MLQFKLEYYFRDNNIISCITFDKILLSIEKVTGFIRFRVVLLCVVESFALYIDKKYNLKILCYTNILI